MDFIKITFDKLDIDCYNQVLSESCGATSIFIGTTRNNFKGKDVVELEYECYEEMAKKEMQKICVKLREQFPNLVNILIYHRLGKVPLKESSILVMTSSPHRKDAIDATEVCVNLVKSTVPIWKKEVYTDGTTEWMSNKECSWS